MNYRWINDYVVDGELKDGYYYIRTWEDMENDYGLYVDSDDSIEGPDDWTFTRRMERGLPPTRCVKVENGTSFFYGCTHYVRPWMVESPAFSVGKEYEFSDDGVDWYKAKYGGYRYKVIYYHDSYRNGESTSYRFCREIPEKKEPVIKLMINDKEVILSEETINNIKNVIKGEK